MVSTPYSYRLNRVAYSAETPLQCIYHVSRTSNLGTSMSLARQSPTSIAPHSLPACQIRIKHFRSLHWRHRMNRHVLNHERTTLVCIKHRPICIHLQKLNALTSTRRPRSHGWKVRASQSYVCRIRSVEAEGAGTSTYSQRSKRSSVRSIPHFCLVKLSRN